MFESIQIEWGEKSASVFIDTERVPYARIHNEGGTIKHPGSNKFQAFGFGDGMVFTHYTKPHDIQIPRRQFMLFQDEDKTAILELLSNAIFSESGTVI
jgi:phage gpG-like protein